MWRSVLVTLHAASGLRAFVAGCLALRRPSHLDTYFWSLVACIALVVAVVAIDWNELAAASRALFTALGALGALMVWRGAQARRIAAASGTQWSARQFDHLGFTLVALLSTLAIDLEEPR
jgi:hypothetical protein